MEENENKNLPNEGGPVGEQKPEKPESPELKWKEHARTWEQRAKENLEMLNAVKAELEKITQADSANRKALEEVTAKIEAAKQEAAKSVEEKFIEKLVLTKFEAVASTAGVTLPENLSEILNVRKFVDQETGDVNTDLVSQFIASFSPPKFDPAFSAGPQGGNPGMLAYDPKSIAERVSKRSIY